MRKVVVFFLMLVTGLGVSHAQNQGSNNRPKGLRVDGVAAVVNDSILLQSERIRRAAPMLFDVEQSDSAEEKARRRERVLAQVLEDMINEELIAQAAAESNIEVSDADVTAAIEDIKKNNKLTDAQFTEALRAQGYTMASYKKDIRPQILRLRAQNQIIRPRVSVSDDEVRARYDAMSRRAGGAERVKLRHILVALPEKPSSAQLADAKTKANAVLDRLGRGEDFAGLAKEVSSDTQTKDSGGELGWIARGTIDSEWEAIVFSMKEDEVRGPVSGPRGLHIFQVTEIEQAQKKAFADIKDALRNELLMRGMEKETQTWLRELREKAHIDLKN